MKYIFFILQNYGIQKQNLLIISLYTYNEVVRIFCEVL